MPDRDRLALEMQIESLRTQLDDARNRSLRLVLADLIRQTAESSPHGPTSGTEPFQQTFQRQQRRIAMNKDIELLAMFARLGDEGVRFLLSVVKDRSTYGEDERQSALAMLGMLPHRYALAYFLQTPQFGNSTSTERTEVLWRQVDGLPTGDVVPYAPALFQEAVDAIARDDSRDGASLLAGLAFLHGDSRSLLYVQDRQFWTAPEFDDVVSAANQLHTEGARAFLTTAAQSHPNPDTRARIAEMVANWEGKPEESTP
jgi:hypothetical protein